MNFENELESFLVDLRSVKPTVRNKAVEWLDHRLNSSMDAMLHENWQRVFLATKDAIFQHSANLQDASEKSYKTLANKCYLYGNAFDKVININLEKGLNGLKHVLSKSCVVSAFEEGIQQRVVVKHFGHHFMDMLARGIYLSPIYVAELEADEYSRILSYLFNLDVNEGEALRTKALKCLTATIQLAQQRVQLQKDIVEYLPTLVSYAQEAKLSDRQVEIVRLYRTFLDALSVNYDHKMCLHMQEILPKLCDYYNADAFRDDTKSIFFECVLLSLHAFYPKMREHDFSSFQVPVSESWPQTLHKLRTIVTMEIRRISMGRGKAMQLLSEKISQNFIQMAAAIMYILLWHIKSSNGGRDDDQDQHRGNDQDEPEVPSKRAKLDPIDNIIDLIAKEETSFHDIWFGIFAELLQLSDAIITMSNCHQLLQLTHDVLLVYGNARNLHNIRLCLVSLLRQDVDKCEVWSQIATHVILDVNMNADVIVEKQLILQAMIRHDKLTPEACASLLQSITTNKLLRRNECIATVREIFIHADRCGLDKASGSQLEPLVNWAYDSQKSNNATQIIHNIAPLDTKLVADTFSIGIINFLDEEQLLQLRTNSARDHGKDNDRLQLLEYKYLKQWVCLEPRSRQGRDLQLKTTSSSSSSSTGFSKNCLFQSNYELLMRMLDVSTSSEHTPSDLIRDLRLLHKLVCTMERLLHYKVFDGDTLMQCTLMKRIGMFLSRIESHYMQEKLVNMQENDLLDVLRYQISVLEIFNSNEILWHYLEQQPIEMLIDFIGRLLRDNSTRRDAIESADPDKLLTLYLHVLGCLCANSSYSEDAFRYIYRHMPGVESQPSDIGLVIKLLCRCKSLSGNIVEWMVDQLRNLFCIHHKNVDIISQVVEHMPIIFKFVYNVEELQCDMMMAMISLLKLGRTSYPSKLTAQIVRCVGLIAEQCPNIFERKSFAKKMSIVKFLNSQTLEVRYAAVATLGQLLNADYCVSIDNAKHKYRLHMDYCDTLYNSIDFNAFTFEGKDDIQNSQSVVVQTLVAVFAFGTFHQLKALQDLANFCYQFSLKDSNFHALKCIVSMCGGVSMRHLMRPYANELLHNWLLRQMDIEKFPYYLCYDSKEEFLEAQGRRLMAYNFLYNISEPITNLRGTITEQECLSILKAYEVLERGSFMNANKDMFNVYHNLLLNNLSACKINFSSIAPNALTLYSLAQLLEDRDEVVKLFGTTVICRIPSEWYNLDVTSLFKCFNRIFLVNTSLDDIRFQVMYMLMFKQPLVLIKLMSMLKADCHDTIHTRRIMRCFFAYCCLADAMLDVAMVVEESNNPDASLLQIYCPYYVLDIWFFVCDFLLLIKCRQIQRAGLKFLQLILPKQHFGRDDYKADQLNGLAKMLIGCVLRLETKQLQQQAAQVVEKFIEMHKAKLNVLALMSEAEDCEYLQSLHELIDNDSPSSCAPLNPADYIKAFLMPNRSDRLHGLREYIAEHKSELQSHENLLFTLVNHLIRMVRDAPNASSSLGALKCLGEIGPLKMPHNSFYFITEFDTFEQSEEDVMEQFVKQMLLTLNKQLFSFNRSTQDALILVASHVVNSRSGAKLSEIHPNLRIFRSPSNKGDFLNSHTSIPAVDWVQLLQCCEHLSYNSWMCTFMRKVFASCGWQGFDEFAEKSFRFANDCQQGFIRVVLANKELHLNSLCAMLDYFFQRLLELQSQGRTYGIYKEQRAIKRMLYICECIRLVNNWDIPLKLSNVISASNRCQAYFLSVMYLELWAHGHTEGDVLADDNFQMLAKTAYESIGCLDAIPVFLNPLNSRLAYHGLNNNLLGCCLELDYLEEDSSRLWSDMMKRLGILPLAELPEHKRQEQRQLDYELMINLGQWDFSVDGHQVVNRGSNMELEFDKHHYMALKSIYQREEENTMWFINNCYECLGIIIRNISVECLQSVYKYMTNLSVLRQAEDFSQIQFVKSLQMNEIFKKWKTDLKLNFGNFSCQEQLLSHHIALFKMAGTRATRRIEEYYKRSPVDEYLLKSIQVCKDAGKLNLASSYVSKLRHMPNLGLNTQICGLLEDADLNVKMGNHQIAKAILQHVLTNKDFNLCPERVTALRMQGIFLLNSKAETISRVNCQNFQKSIKVLNDLEQHRPSLEKRYPNVFDWGNFETFALDNRKAAHAAMAKYADAEYQQLYKYRHSQEYQMIGNIIRENRDLATTVNRGDNDSRAGAISLTRFAALDDNDLKRIDSNLTDHLCTAVTHYIAYCRLDENECSSAAIYRIIALWFANDQNTELLAKIAQLIPDVPSYKFISAVNQLAGRLNTKNVEFQKVLVELLTRCARDHPQQTFYKLYPLVYAHMDGNHGNTQRSAIAKEIIVNSCKGNVGNAKLMQQFESMFPALITFANTYRQSNAPNGKISASDVLPKIKILNQCQKDLIHCPTLHLDVHSTNPTAYNIIHVVRWKSDYTICAGLNAPIKMHCLCSDGVVRPQLIKGKDDLRQDAMMQQVFGIVNELLNSDSEYVERKLQLRTYKVTPLSMRSGILEWCSNTIPVGTYLVGSGGAHMRYRPNDWTGKRCREMLHAVLRKDPALRMQTYATICANIKPVLQYFLLEKFHIPGEWFERRLAYINSVATTSMVGYVLGLGDRHTQNILIDERTAEVVHIDFGIAFEQGRIQATPETVPFRLTRDFVAPMGVCGTNGVFTKSCEATMHILRRYQPVISTILEVLLYDPLFIWGVLSKGKSSPSSEESKNLLAQRALIQVQHKLQGRESGVMDNSSVETQVERLINEATLPSNLALLYPGWDPYL